MFREYLSQVGRFSRPARIFLLALFFQYMGQTIVWVLRNLYLKEAGFNESFIGSTLSASSAGAVVMVILLAGFMDRMRLKRFLLGGSAAISVGLIGVALVPQPAPVLAFSTLTGMGLGAFQMSVAVFFVRHSGFAERPYLFGVGQALLPASGLITTLAMKGGALLLGENIDTYRIMMIVGGLMPIFGFLLVSTLREKPPEPPLKKEQKEKMDWRLGLKFWLPEFFIGLGAGLTIPFINLYFRNRFEMPAGSIGLIYSGAQLLMVVAFLASPLFSRRLGAIRTIIIFQLVSLPFFFTMAFTTILPLAIGAFLVRQTCMNMAHPISDTFMMEVAHPRQRARLNGMKQLARRGAWVIATAVSGILIEHTSFIVDGFTTVMLITIAFYIIGTTLYWRFFRGAPEGQADFRTFAPQDARK